MTKDPVDVHVGQKLRRHRRDRRLSLETVAQAIGVTYQQVQKYENATNRVSASQLWRLATYLGVDVASFFPNAGHPTADLGLIAKLDGLPPHIRSIIGNLAYAIAVAEKRASALSGLQRTDPT